MESVLISIKPEWLKKIIRGEKTIEVRKSAPKEVPFRAYIYETKAATDTPWADEDGHLIFKGRGQVIGEFICDEVEELHEWELSPQGKFADFERERLENFLTAACLSEEEVVRYRENLPYFKPLYGWHISDLKIYDKPKELSEFWGRTNCPAADTVECWNCFAACREINGRHYQPLSRPSQSWQYVEALEK